jgi:hypothetical protein
LQHDSNVTLAGLKQPLKQLELRASTAEGMEINESDEQRENVSISILIKLNPAWALANEGILTAEGNIPFGFVARAGGKAQMEIAPPIQPKSNFLSKNSSGYDYLALTAM